MPMLKRGSRKEEWIVAFRCRKCPGKIILREEKKAHKLFHRYSDRKEQAMRERDSRPNTRSIVSERMRTMFPGAVPVVGAPTNAAVGERVGFTNKIQSRKSYDNAVIGAWVKGSGA